MPANSEDASMLDPEPDQPLVLRPENLPIRKPVVIGVYGLPGCGKTTLLGELWRRISHETFAFYEG